MTVGIGSTPQGARRALLVAEATEVPGPDAPGLIVLSSDWEIESITPGTRELLDDLPDGDAPSRQLPSALTSVATRVLRRPSDVTELVTATARVRARSGRWMVLHGAPFTSNDGRAVRAAVIVEPARDAHITLLLMSVYGLTEREQDVTRLVLQGASTTEIAAHVFISAHTVRVGLLARSKTTPWRHSPCIST